MHCNMQKNIAWTFYFSPVSDVVQLSCLTTPSWEDQIHPDFTRRLNSILILYVERKVDQFKLHFYSVTAFTLRLIPSKSFSVLKILERSITETNFRFVFLYLQLQQTSSSIIDNFFLNECSFPIISRTRPRSLCSLFSFLEDKEFFLALSPLHTRLR